jgi:hypothetical protein
MRKTVASVLQLSDWQMRRHCLAKQHLASGAGRATIESIAEDLVGLHATGTTSPYLQLLARMPGFQRSDLDRALYHDRSLARVRCMRGTVFIVTRALLPIALAATRGSIEPPSTRYLATLGVDVKDFRRLSDRIERELERTDEALSAAELRGRTGAKASLSGVVNLMCDQARLLRDRPVGTWRSRTFTYRLFGDVFPHVGSIDEDDAVRLLTDRYLRAHGPITMDDLVWWSGLALRKLQPAVDELGDAVVKVDIDGVPGAYFVHADEVDHLSRAAPDKVPDVVSMLPELDPYPMSRKNRDMILGPDQKPYTTDRSGNVTSLIIVGGRGAGVWDISETPDPAVRIHLFDKPPAPVLDGVQRQADRFGEFWFERRVPTRAIASMTPLNRRSAGAFLSPLAETD